MKEFFHKIMAISMALLVLVSTVSFAVDMHFCGDDLADFSFFEETASCGMEVPKATAGHCQMMKMDCCSDELLILEKQDELITSFDQLNLNQQLFVSAFAYSYIALFENLPKQIIPFKDYSPPPLISDIHLINETFLI